MNAHYIPYTEISQRLGFNNEQKENYDKDSLTIKHSKSEKVTNATSKLSFHMILRKTQRDKQPEILKQQIEIAKRLMMVLYQGQAFFKPVEENPALLDRLFDELITSIDSRKKLITRIKDLSKVTLPNKDTSDILYSMLRGMEQVEKKHLPKMKSSRRRR